MFNKPSFVGSRRRAGGLPNMSQMQSLNGKRPASSTMRYREDRVVPSQHDDLIKYIYESWHKVSREVENYNQNGSENGKGLPCVAYYYENEPNPLLKDFQPFDLDDWWRKRNSASRNQPSS